MDIHVIRTSSWDIGDFTWELPVEYQAFLEGLPEEDLHQLREQMRKDIRDYLKIQLLLLRSGKDYAIGAIRMQALLRDFSESHRRVVETLQGRTL